MWNCNICKKVKVPETGFKLFIGYQVLDMLGFPKTNEKIATFGHCRHQIRICPKCLKKRSVEIELN